MQADDCGDFTQLAGAVLLLPNLNRFNCNTVAKALGVSLENHHRAVDDAGIPAEIFCGKFIETPSERGIGAVGRIDWL